MLANCGALGIDWERVSMSAYMGALEAHNEAHDPEAAKRKPEVSDWLRNAVNSGAWN